MTELQIKNETIITINTISRDIEIIKRKLDTIYSKNLPNIGEIYRNKIYDLEMIFQKSNLPFYKDNILSEIILSNFDNLLVDSCLAVNELADKLLNLSNNYIIGKIQLTVYSKYVNDYDNLCKELEGFSFEKDLNKYIIEFFKSRRYYEYSPGWFFESYLNLKNILKQLNIEYGDLDKYIMPIIELQEKEIKFLYEAAKEEIMSDNVEDIRNYIDNVVTEIYSEQFDIQKIR